MVTAVVQRDLHIDHGITGENTALHGFLNAVLDGLEVLSRYRAALDLIHELEAFALFIGVDVKLHVAVLPAPASLTDIFAFRFGVLADGLAVGHLRLTHVGFNLVLAHHAVDDDFQVQFAHAADDGLSRIGVGCDFERRVFLRQPAQGDAHLFLVAFGLGFDGHGNYRRGESDGLQQDGGFFRADGVTGGDVLEAYASADVAGKNLADLFALVGVHFQQTADAFALAARGVQHTIAGLEMSRVNAHEGKLAHKRVGHDFEG